MQLDVIHQDHAPLEYLPITREHRENETIKFCQRTHDGLEIESVIIPMGGKGIHWNTLCVSSQVGCARGCTFCQTGRMGLLRNLTLEEIVGQIRAANRHFGAAIRNVVFMGMGEPMDNLDHVIPALKRLHEDREFDIARKRLTVSTVGRCDGIRRLATLGWRRLGLAISLNAPNDEIRSRIMPINRTDSMTDLRQAISEWPLRGGGHVLIEYVLLRGVNDEIAHARELVDYLRGLKTCVNLIPWNPIDGIDFQSPDEARANAFQLELMNAGQLAFQRRVKGRSALGACGQLGNIELKRTRAADRHALE
jgi:23S rRNA (adenine2503-C2)-methyltransferase